MKTVILAIAIALGLLGSVLVVPAAALDPFPVCQDAAAQNSTLCQGRGDSSNNPLTGTGGLLFGIAKILAWVAGLSAVITIIVSALRLIAANGDANTVKSAQQAIVAALVGIVLIVLAGSIISLVLSRI